MDDPGIGGSISASFVRHSTEIWSCLLEVNMLITQFTVCRHMLQGQQFMIPQVPQLIQGQQMLSCASPVTQLIEQIILIILLQWDYDPMDAGGGGADVGCFTCHMQKND